MDFRTKEEQSHDRKHPLISLNSGQQKDFIKYLFLKIKNKALKKMIYHLKEEAKIKERVYTEELIEKDKKIKRQKENLSNLLRINEELKKLIK